MHILIISTRSFLTRLADVVLHSTQALVHNFRAEGTNVAFTLTLGRLNTAQLSGLAELLNGAGRAAAAANGAGAGGGAAKKV